MTAKLQNRIHGIPYNMALITVGAFIFGLGLKGIALPHSLITGGISGLSLLIYYWTGLFTPGVLYILVNIPIFILAWRFISRRFFFYSLYGTVVLTLAIDLIEIQLPVHDPILAIMAGGCLIGAGAGIILHSLGSAGGNDVIAVILNQRYNIRIGTFFFIFNIALFTFSFGRLPVDLVLYSLAMSFVTSQVLEYFLNISNQRKMALIVTLNSDRIAAEILKKMRRGVTFLEGRGAYTGKKKDVLLTVVHTLQIKRLEELVYGIDPNAFVIMGNTFNVLGKGFSSRKTY
jgi:uncharacterized membrane-anchored protein YitT (DUF2179 family)